MNHAEVDLSACDREPIHAPGSVQPHGVLVVAREADFVVVQVSRNVAAFLGDPPDAVLGRTLSDVLGRDEFALLREAAGKLPASGEPMSLGAVRVNARRLHAVGHRADGGVVFEFEPAPDERSLIGLHPVVASFIAKVQGIPRVADLAAVTCAEVRRLTGLDRALAYRFDADGTGVVVAEDGSGRLPSLQDHRFPASDIPLQARELYRRNRMRLIPDAGYTPVPLVPAVNPLTGRPLDMTYATLRSVSPVHVEYMRNMETAASMSVSVLRDGQLWGLIACHHAEPRVVPFEARTACDLLAQVFALQVAAREHAADIERRVEIRAALTRLLAHMASAPDYALALLDHPEDLLPFVAAAGAAVVADGKCECVGRTPDEKLIRRLADWLFRDPKVELFHTDALAERFPEAADSAATASGVLAVRVSKLHPTAVLWFRPEVIETIRWGGDPRKTADRLHPRKSFETWSQTVRGRAVPWLPGEVEGAAELRNAVLGIVLRKAEETAALTVELTRSNKELEAFSYSVSHDLRAPLRHIVGYAELLKEAATGKLPPGDLKHADTIIESSVFAGKLVDNLLAYSRMGRAALERMPLDMNALVREVRDDVMKDFPGRKVRWEFAPLPTVRGVLMMLRVAVRNLLGNAVKYTRDRDEAVVAVGCRAENGVHVFHVRDNGVGFDMRYRDKLFGVFQRLHKWEEFEGTGIGLANVRRVVERHGGKTWAEGEAGKGATFYFALPAPPDHNGA